jgi:phage anti-repressor protein
MEEFILQRTTISKKFLRDFFNITGEKYNDNVVSIKFDTIVKWLNVEKKNLKRLLVKNFKKDIDYTEEKVKVMNKNRGSNYVSKILVTPDCFKDICMISMTEKAKEVRVYYKTVEKLLIDYYQDIQFNLQKELGLIKNNQKPKNEPKGGHVYILQAHNTTQKDMFKIGNSKDMKKRFRTYNSANANDIKPLFIMRVHDIDGVEKCIKNVAKQYQYRKNKEVYQIDFRMLQSMYTNCKDFMERSNELYNKNSKNFKHNLLVIKKDYKKSKETQQGGFYMLIDKNLDTN